MSERGRGLFDRIIAFFREAPAMDGPTGAGPIPPVVVLTEGFVDIELGLRRLGPGRFRLAAMAGSREIGFEFVLGGKFSATEIAPGLSVWWGTLRIQSVGPPSDAFLAFLDEQYGTERRPVQMRQEILAAVAVLEGNPGHPERGLKTKLFFEEKGDPAEVEVDEEEEEARPGTPEVYLNLDPARRRASWSEKNEGYRSDLIYALTQPPPGR